MSGTWKMKSSPGSRSGLNSRRSVSFGVLLSSETGLMLGGARWWPVNLCLAAVSRGSDTSLNASSVCGVYGKKKSCTEKPRGKLTQIEKEEGV